MVHRFLLAAVEGRYLMDDKSEDDPQYGSGKDKHESKPSVQHEGHGDSQSEHDGASNQRTESSVHRVLHDGDVRRHTRHKGRSGKAVQIGKRVFLKFFVLRLAERGSETIGRTRGETGVPKAADQGESGAYGHFSALKQEIGDIMGGDSHIHNIRHDKGNDHLEYGFNTDQRDGYGEIFPVRPRERKNFF